MGSLSKSLCLALGVGEDLPPAELAVLFDRALSEAREKVEQAEGRVNRQRAERRLELLEQHTALVERLRAEIGLGPLLEKARIALDRGQTAAAGVYLKRGASMRSLIKDEDLLLELDALQAEWEALSTAPGTAGGDRVPPEVDTAERAELDGTPEPEPLVPEQELREKEPGLETTPDSAAALEPLAQEVARENHALVEDEPETAGEGTGEAEEPPPLPPRTEASIPAEPVDDFLDTEVTMLTAPLPQEGRPCDCLTLEFRGRRLHVMTRQRVQFGRDGKTCDLLLRVDHPENSQVQLVSANRRISRRHFFIERTGGSLTVVDGSMEDGLRHASSGGTYLDEEPIEVEQLRPGASGLLSVSSPSPSDDYAHWALHFRDWREGVPQVLIPVVSGLPEVPGNLWMCRRDLIEEDVLLLWSAMSLELLGPELKAIWLCRHYNGYALFDEKSDTFLDWENATPGSALGSTGLKLLSRGYLEFQDPTARGK